MDVRNWRVTEGRRKENKKEKEEEKRKMGKIVNVNSIIVMIHVAMSS